MQQTLNARVEMTGIGLHSGAEINLAICPAPTDSGITFIRTDVKGKENTINALWDRVVNTQLCTVIGNDDGVSVATIEHLMSALRGCGVDNATIELDAGEVPAMDGSAEPFVQKIDSVGIKTQSAPRKVIKVLKEVSVEHDGKRVTLKPADQSIFGGEIEFDHPSIKKQKFQTTLLNGNFRHDIAAARTFGFRAEVEYMQANGRALGGSHDNAIVLSPDAIENVDGLRFETEFIRHKLLDAIGDLYLAGYAIIGAYDGLKAGHAINNEILHALFADESAYEIITLDGDAPTFIPDSDVCDYHAQA